jgi:cytochrome subunit of sulfide dehydrogenase
MRPVRLVLGPALAFTAALATGSAPAPGVALAPGGVRVPMEIGVGIGMGIGVAVAAEADPDRTAAGSPAPSGTLSGAPFDAPPGASGCSGCHGGVAPLPVLAGRPAADIVSAMAAFRAGERPATVMTRIAKGFTPEETTAIARWWSQRK